MFDLKKLEDNNAIFWIFKFPEYRSIAAECGWAIAIHGSAVHDLDLMAMPWIENHTTADELAQRLTDTEQPNFRRPYVKSKPGDKHITFIAYYEEDKRENDKKKLMQAINGELAKDGLHIPTKEE